MESFPVWEAEKRKKTGGVPAPYDTWPEFSDLNKECVGFEFKYYILYLGHSFLKNKVGTRMTE